MTIRIDISVPENEQKSIDIDSYIDGKYQHTERISPGQSTFKHVWKGSHLEIKETDIINKKEE